MKKVGVALVTLLLLLGILPNFVVAQECFLPCTVTEECNLDQTCADNCCVANNCQVPCTSDAECTLDHTCDTEQSCCVPIPCTITGECPTPCPAPTAYSPASTFFLLQCNYCQYGFCVDPPPPPPPCCDYDAGDGDNDCTDNDNAECGSAKPHCVGTVCSECTQDSDCPGQLCKNPSQSNADCVDCLGDGDCDDGNSCTDDSCNTNSGNCQFMNDNSNTCTDGDPCTDDACMGGQCNSGQINCDDNDDCNGIETCSGGNCQSGTPVDCDDQDPCTTDTCNPNNGNCGNQQIQGCCVDNSGCNLNQCQQCIANACKDCSGGADNDFDGFPEPVC